MGYFYLWVRTCWVSAQTIIRSGISSVTPCRLARTWNIRCYKWDLPFFQDSSEPDSKVGLHPEQSWQSWPPLQFQFGNLWKFVPAPIFVFSLTLDGKKWDAWSIQTNTWITLWITPVWFLEIFSHTTYGKQDWAAFGHIWEMFRKKMKTTTNLGLWQTHTHLLREYVKKV